IAIRHNCPIHPIWHFGDAGDLSEHLRHAPFHFRFATQAAACVWQRLPAPRAEKRDDELEEFRASPISLRNHPDRSRDQANPLRGRLTETIYKKEVAHVCCREKWHLGS